MVTSLRLLAGMSGMSRCGGNDVGVRRRVEPRDRDADVGLDEIFRAGSSGRRLADPAQRTRCKARIVDQRKIKHATRPRDIRAPSAADSFGAPSVAHGTDRPNGFKLP